VEHAFFESVLGINPTANRRAIQFPVAETDKKWRDSRIHSYVLADFVQNVQALQPFLAGEPREHPMWILHELAIQDRHMEFLVAAVVPQGIEVHFDLTTTGNVVTRGPQAGTLVVDGGAQTFLTPVGTPFEGRVSYPFEVVFSESLAAQRKSVLGVLAELHDFVSAEVLPVLDSRMGS
jgi:hypothetical protein